MNCSNQNAKQELAACAAAERASSGTTASGATAHPAQLRVPFGRHRVVHPSTTRLDFTVPWHNEMKLQNV